MNFLDRAINYLAPGWGLRRLARRNLLDQALNPPSQEDTELPPRWPSGWLNREYKPGEIPGPESDDCFEALQRLSHFRKGRKG
jgi:hypothetical protein